MKLAGVLLDSEGYPLDDPAVMVFTAVREVIAVCAMNNVPMVGAFEMALTETWDGGDTGLRWEFTADVTPGP